jgi:phage terminase large subunit
MPEPIIEIDIDEEVFNPIFLPFITEKPETVKPFTFMEGGRASGKSRDIAQFFVKKALEEKIRFGLVRKVFDTIRDSQYKEIQDVVDEWGLNEHFTFLKAPLTIFAKHTGSEFVTKGLDKSEKIKSLASIDYLWVEELTELTHEDYQTLNFTIRGKRDNGKIKRRFYSWNRTAGNWTEEDLFFKNGKFRVTPSVYHLHTTFRDNKFLSPEDLAMFKELSINDPEAFKKIAEGLPVELKGLIFPHWDEVDEIPHEVKDRVYGLDFGYNDPTVLVELGFAGKDLFIDEKYYHTGKTPSDFKNDFIELKNSGLLLPKQEMYADAEAPDKIEELCRAGFNCIPSNKEKNSVQYGIELVKGFNIHVTKRSTNVKKDLQIYKWKLDKNGNPIDAPAHVGSHSPDATRYGAYTHLEPIIKPAVQGDIIQRVNIVSKDIHSNILNQVKRVRYENKRAV